MGKITIFTPTYNRRELLKRVYESLQCQTCKDFIWLVVDDGSTDDTKTLVNKWAENEQSFKIRYVYKENGGLQSGYVEAIKHIETELAICLDSDDYFVDTAIEQVLSLWAQKGSDKYAGVLALDMKKDGHIIGGKYPNDKNVVNILDLDTGRIKRPESDRVLAIRTELYRKAKPAKKYPGENTLNATYLHLQIALENEFLVLNEPICVVEYQPGGISMNKKKQYFDRPNNFADWRLFCMSLPNAPLKYYVKNNMHYIAECIIAHRKMLKDSPRKLETFLLIPFGFVLWVYLKKTVKN